MATRKKRPSKRPRDPIEHLCREFGKTQKIVRDVHDLAINTAGKVQALTDELVLVKARITARPPKK